MGQAPADYVEFAHASSGRLFRTACLLTGDWHRAEDLVQETLAKMYRSWRRISHDQPPVAYAHTVLVRTYLAQRRRLGFWERVSDRLDDSAEARPDRADLRLTLLDGLARLPVADRAVLVLRYWEDRSVEETARILRIPPATARTRSLRALRRLRALLGEDLAELSAD
ncbi:SigE family RNA polymerase sigma factor [Kitasatospora paracochleata]|uniref:RNA polymerase sigma-70 factor (Sigma-E family) n=1 Tax=Kitasatospora paracochleata TaxID=58354 RepID=A0ABT1J2L0_9ACTN|nr:sigma-70 family RNA polymerase sigma factor [Kitasatospora paracochleata]MCP2311676.1 RNA polymerase sigma-70 factor (sigma-E family) [Kitasatospora paracochleata]